ncbi:exopolysaccharide biosynthesis polyprenyl glycosylphosphotransferase [Phenylobacterium sp.]|uniref:exopolysaccharide biosynthesis polyprenyl glycosylphosphotransferase n=1 Tax=Phenylobacterium sp. TaxID=1871053 RepID=UPI00272F7E4E|nr:exopolysaccharide biosynthesis polyprenyl glycosylphosphotransferase [Phenylobacterium sp.]MDP1616472.1 exopolysaccharide biosynthesis polyprenyl glycosylphosphotransferase [Phenylobacterium sp.]MDP1988019.1 exopolysaccharide biosynthesis polyprenyl glycosylphosphotransferase [Phenylobacterium sp.]
MSNLVRLPQASPKAPRPSPADHAPEAEAEAKFALGLEQGLEGALPPAESAPVQDRRGPMRPDRLSPTRRRLQGQAYAWAFQAADGACLLVIALVAFLVGPGPAGVYATPALAVMIALSLFDAYGFRSRQGLAYHLAQTSVAAALGVLTAVALLAAFLPLHAVVAALGSWTVAAFLSIYALHAVWWLMVRRWRGEGRLTPNVVVVGATPAAERLIGEAIRSGDVNVLGIFDDRLARVPSALRGVPVLGDTQALLDHRIMPYVDRVIVAVPTGARDRVRQVIEALRPLPNEISLLLEDEIAPVDAVAVRGTQSVSDLPLARIAGPPRHLGRAITKRSLDLTIGVVAMIAALPIMALIALAIRLDSPGPILFRQRRQGFNNEEIVVWKFRSMRHDLADARARQQVQADDVRVTRVGRFIRRTSLDELPQIFNVLTGEMSLVGPRPHAIGMMTGDVESARLVAEYAHRHRMKPGITGWAAIHGSRGPVDTPADVRRRIQLDIEYIERQSVWLDLYIIAMTIPCLFGDRQAVR